MKRRRRRRRVYWPNLFRTVAVFGLVLTAIILLPKLFGNDNQLPNTDLNVTQSPTDAPSATSTAIDSTDQPQETPTPQLPTEPSEPTDKPNDTSSKVIFRAIGDIMNHENQLKSALVDKNKQTYDFEPVFSMLGDSLSRADYTIANLETTIGNTGKYGYSGYPQFNTPENILPTMKNVGVDMFTLANNHILDRYCDGAVTTIDACEKYGFDHVGAFRTQKEFDTPEIVEIEGIKVGFIAYTLSTNTMETVSDPVRVKYTVKYLHKANFDADVKALRNKGAELVIALPHWGTEYKRDPDTDVKNYAKKMVAAGVDIIIGNHPHVVQKFEMISANDAQGNTRTALCVYSLGNFISDQRTQYRDTGIILEFAVNRKDDGNGFDITDVKYVPTWVWRYVRSGSGDKTIYDYRVLRIGDYLDEKPDGMSTEAYNRLKAAWTETVEMVGETIAKPSKK